MSPTSNLVLPGDLQGKFNRLEDVMRGRVFERNWEIRTALLCLIARKHHGQIGPPGIAKTMLVDELVNLIGGLKPLYFRWLMTKFTTPPELFGPVSLEGLKNDVQRFNTTGKLPTAHVVFLDEMFKANSAILNALLTVMNERLFFNNGSDPNVPLSSIFAGSNELPIGAELAPLADRITVKHLVGEMREKSNFIKMMRSKARGVPRVEPVIQWDDILLAQKEAAAVTVSDVVFDKMAELRSALHTYGIHPTPRRFNDSLDIIKAHAWRDGRAIADLDDLRPCEFILWENTKDIPVVKKLVLEMANPLDKEAQELVDLVEQLAAEVDEVTKGDPSMTKTRQQQLGTEVYGKLQRCDERLDDLLKEAKKSPRQGKIVEEAKARVAAVIEGLLYDLFGMRP